MTGTAIDAWLAEIGDGDIEDWANKGLLRRGRKLAEAAGADGVAADGEQLIATLDGHRQRLRGAGFERLDCGCAALGPCHHLIAFLLLAKSRRVETAAAPAGAEPSAPDWLLGDQAALTRQLGQAHVARAGRWMRLGLVPELEEGPGGWVGEVTERESYRVRMARSAGPEAATCTCGGARCAHRALVVLELRRRLGLFDPASVEDALSTEQTGALAAVERWMLQLATAGLTGVTLAATDQGRVLATAARQADLPRVGALLAGLLDLLEARQRGRSFAGARGIGERLAALRLLTAGLKKASPRVPLLRLTGVNRALYRKVSGLRLIGVAAEHWQGQQGQEGISLHCYAPREARWYRLSETRRPVQDQPRSWNPVESWNRGRWADGPLLRELPAAEVLLHLGWVSAEGRLSGRPGTRLEHRALREPAAELPIQTDFAAVRRRFAEAMADDLMAPPPRLPVVIRIAETAAPRLDTQSQWWTQRLTDAAGAGLTLGILIRDPVNALKRQRMEAFGAGPARGRLIFGTLYRSPSGLVLDPIALLNDGAAAWTSLTLR
ncbi:hypothetical protein [Thiocystis violacea]|uniref:hypothetical protein n=1 Tax=Thiocystis violacea TaxID=13725 RepID=UPI001908DF97|nr:hypothetical protein [Thiocystis violacea]MBK1721268.1 hypothetical protein [Thiocystis violacea]